MALTNDEAQQFADQLIADYLAGVEPDPISVYGALTNDDQIPIGKHLVPRLTVALEAFNSGDRSADTVKLVQWCLAMEAQRELDEATRAQRKRDELRAKALAFGGNPVLAAQMTQISEFYGIPLPATAERLTNDTWQVQGFSPDDLFGFYLRFMAAAGWALDLRASASVPGTRPGTRYSSLVYGLPDPPRWVIIRIWDDPEVAEGRPAIQLQITNDDDPPVFDPLGMATPT